MNLDPKLIVEAANTLKFFCHGQAKENGWWTELVTDHPLHAPNKNVGELLCLVYSEISEAMEGDRKKLMDDKLPHRTMLEVELADALICIFDISGGLGLDVAGAVAEKLQFNATRLDHKKEHRNAVGGKRY